MSRAGILCLTVLVGALAWVNPALCSPPCEKLLSDKIKPCEGSDFCGIWGEAKWGGILPHCLAVEGKAGDLRAVYAWGRAAEWNIHSPGQVRVKAYDTGDTLKMTLDNGARVEYDLIDGQLHGNYYLNEGASSIVMGRVAD